MSFAEGVDYDPEEIEQYVVSNLDFFKRWALNNITLNQLNSILIEQQLMVSSPPTAQRGSARPITEESTFKTESHKALAIKVES